MERSNDLLVSAIARSDYRSMPDANWTFHRAVLRAAGNPLLTRMIEEVWAKSSRFRLGYRLIPGRAENTVTEHAQILAAARAHDLEALVAATREHVEQAGIDLVRELTADGL